MSWCRELHDRGVAAVVDTFSIIDWVTPGDVSRGITPCPVCRQPTRHRRSRDRRGALALTSNGYGWYCLQCDARGDAVALASLLITGDRTPTSLVREECSRYGLIGHKMPIRHTVVSAQSRKLIWGSSQAHNWWQHAETTRLGYTQADLYIQGTRGFPPDNRRMIHSGYASISSIRDIEGWPKEAQEQVSWMLRRNRLLVLPIRDSYRGYVRALAIKGFARQPRCSLLTGQLMEYDSCPYGYGNAGGSLRSNIFVLCEGAMDTLAAEYLTHGMEGVGVAGAISDGCMRRAWSAWLAGRKHGHVIVIHHRDRAGINAAQAVVDKIRNAGGSARLANWERLLKVADRSEHERINDLADLMMIAGPNRVDLLAKSTREEIMESTTRYDPPKDSYYATHTH